MTEEMIHSIIDDIAHDAKIIVSEHLHPERACIDDLAETLKQSAKDWDEVGEEMSKVFRSLEDNVRAYVDKYCADASRHSEFRIGDKVVFICNGCAVEDRISRVLVETANGYQVYVEDVYRSMDELVEHLKKKVHG